MKAFAEYMDSRTSSAGSGIELNEEQQSAVDKIRAFLRGDDQFFGLYGYAGTGKTTTIHEALRGAVERVAMSAPTHKAVGVLARMDHDASCEFATIHRLLGCRRQYKDGEIFYAPDLTKDQAIHGFDVVVIDECSMIGEKMWDWVQDAVRGNDIKIIVMGDPMQLPPVSDGEVSPTFDLPSATLTRIMRHEGVIESAATAMRKAVDADELPLAEDGQDEHGEVVNLHQSDFIERMMGDLDRCKVLAYTNDAVDWINDHIRMEVFGEEARPFEPRERLVLVESYSTDLSLLHTETEIQVDAAHRAKRMGLDCWQVMVTDEHGGKHELFCLDDGQKGEFLRKLRKARDRGKAGGGWKPYYDLKEGFARVRPGWATTIHKSQGSTYDHVYLIQTNVLSTAGYDHELCAMLLYVGYSRARKKLILS